MREAEAAYRRETEDLLSSNNNTRQDVQHITSYKSSNLSAAEGDTLLAEELNLFFARSKVESPEVSASHPPAHSSHVLTVEEHEVTRTLRAENLDGVAGQVLQDQLAVVFIRIFNQSLITVPPYLYCSPTAKKRPPSAV